MPQASESGLHVEQQHRHVVTAAVRQGQLQKCLRRRLGAIRQRLHHHLPDNARHRSAHHSTPFALKSQRSSETVFRAGPAAHTDVSQ